MGYRHRLQGGATIECMGCALDIGQDEPVEARLLQLVAVGEPVSQRIDPYLGVGGYICLDYAARLVVPGSGCTVQGESLADSDWLLLFS